MTNRPMVMQLPPGAFLLTTPQPPENSLIDTHSANVLSLCLTGSRPH